jgi:hypothetical protein
MVPIPEQLLPFYILVILLILFKNLFRSIFCIWESTFSICLFQSGLTWWFPVPPIFVESVSFLLSCLLRGHYASCLMQKQNTSLGTRATQVLYPLPQLITSVQTLSSHKNGCKFLHRRKLGARQKKKVRIKQSRIKVRF